MLTKLSKEIHQANVEKGFYDDEKNIGEMLALIHSEVSEALEAHRKNRIAALRTATLARILHEPDQEFKEEFEKEIKDTVEDELADAIIRILDMCGYLQIDIENHVMNKLRYNTLRPYKHGKKY